MRLINDGNVGFLDQEENKLDNTIIESSGAHAIADLTDEKILKVNSIRIM